MKFFMDFYIRKIFNPYPPNSKILYSYEILTNYIYNILILDLGCNQILLHQFELLKKFILTYLILILYNQNIILL